jgi:hypothetical protein
MLVKPQLEATLRQYVLGELDEEARVDLEERLVTEPDLFELLGPTEDELAEEYLENVLSATERTGFEGHFLISEERRWQLGFLRLLKDRASTIVSDGAEQAAIALVDPIVQRRSDSAGTADPMKARRDPSVVSWATLARSTGFFRHHPMWAASLAASVAILLAGNAWFVFRGKSLGDELGRLRAEHQVEQRAQRGLQTRLDRLSAQALALRTELESERQQGEAIEARGPHVQTQGVRPTRAQAPPLFVLATGLLRSEGSMTRIAIPPDAPLIRLRLELSAVDYPLYRAVLYDAQGEEIWAQSKLSARASDGRAAVTVVLPSLLLPPGDYQLKLSGTDGTEVPESVAAFAFRATAP